MVSRLRRRRRQPRLREHALPRRATARSSTATRSGASSRTGRPRSRPHYDTAERMLGVTTYEGDGPADTLLRELATRWASPRPTRPPASGSSSASPARPSPDPYFGGDGPPRAGCIRCGACMVGCRHNAKNTLVKNYLWFAERNGVADHARAHRRRRSARSARADGSDGYAVTSEHSGAWFRKDRQRADRARRRRRRRRARHEPAAPALPPRRLAAAALGSPRPPRPHQQRGDHRRHHQGRPPRLHQVDRDHLELLSGRRHPHRDRHLRPRRRLDARCCSRSSPATARA